MNICCRQSFKLNELIQQGEDHSFEFKNISLFDSNPINDFNIKKTICGMLNGGGGYLFLGIDEDVYDRSHRVKGYVLNENEKEVVKKYFNSISELFYPVVDTSKKEILVSFVNVETKAKEAKYVVKVVINKGKENCFYSFKHRMNKLSQSTSYNELDCNLFFKRYDNETKVVSSMSQVYREILQRNQIKETISCKPKCQCKSKNIQQLVELDQQKHDITIKKQNIKLRYTQPSRYSKQSTQLQQSYILPPPTSQSILIQLTLQPQPSQPSIQPSLFHSFTQSRYNATLVTNIPQFYEEQIQKIIDNFELKGFVSSDLSQGFKSFMIPLQSRDEHRKFQKEIKKFINKMQFDKQIKVQQI